MARIRSWAGKQGAPALSGKLTFKARRGILIVSKWPRSRGKKPHPNQVKWHNWMREANRLAKYLDPEQQKLAIEYTRGTGLYPRDLLLKVMSTGLVDVMDDQDRPIISKRWELEPVTWQGFMIDAGAGLSVGSGQHPIAWGLPVLQTMPFWDAGSPTKITIPTGVTVMNLEMGIGWPNTNTVSLRLLIVNATTGLTVAFSNHGAIGRPGATIATGPLLVTPGEQFEAWINPSQAATLAGEMNYFRGTILEAA